MPLTTSRAAYHFPGYCCTDYPTLARIAPQVYSLYNIYPR